MFDKAAQDCVVDNARLAIAIVMFTLRVMQNPFFPLWIQQQNFAI